MKGKRFTAEQIIRILQEADAGLSVADVCLKHNCESFNLIFRTTCLDRWLFCSMTEARVVIINWLEEYNTIRPHGSLGGMNPEFFTAIEQTTHLLNTDDARSDIVDYIEMFYNSKRRHGFNDLLSPVEYENRFSERLVSV